MPPRSLVPMMFALCLALAAPGALADPRAAQYTEDPGPTASFTFTPASPESGEAITFVSTSRPSQGQITALDWDFDGDGDFEDAHGATVTRAFDPGSYTVQLRVTQTNGKQKIAFKTVEVPEPPRTRPRRIRPFPLIRIAGVVLPHAALVRVLSVRAPRGAVVRVRCRGRGCPVRSMTRRVGSRLLRVRRFERRLPAGTVLAVFVRQGDRIGKYTRFLIRGGKAPLRVDRCLMPGATKPARCP